MEYLRARLALLLLLAATASPAQIAAPIPTPLDQWQPVSPGTWRIKSLRSDSGGQAETTTSLACPYSALLFMNSMANIKLGEAGCRHETYRLSAHSYHIATRCAALRAKDHIETTTLLVSDDGRRFVAATTWSSPHGHVTLQREGEFLSECKAN